MTRVSITELKANLSRYLREVRRGGEVQVLHRGVPVARLTRLPARSRGNGELREELVQGGLLRPGQGEIASSLDPPLPVGKSVLASLLGERSDRL